MACMPQGFHRSFCGNKRFFNYFLILIYPQGFNRSFCGKNATMYGKGVYFARESEYSARTAYSVPDKHGVQYMFLCRVVVGEYCQGVQDALTPAVRTPQR